ncbi:MFS transporter [Nocardia panacis]|uniref:MFS transporter n=1 Tax=Nocardia panacis TaxID=2340916 RepID=UPI001EF04E77|nr:MFS transporter [Nocardia panacis]
MNLRTDTRITVLRTPVVWFMALAAAIGTATTYPLQPAIAEVAESLHTSVAAVGAALACGPIGYLAGLALLVPLVDRFTPRVVVSVQFGVLATALAICATVGSPWPLGAAIGLIGAGSSVGAQLSSVAGRFAQPGRRATVLGIVTAGISAGILAGRIVGGWLVDVMGWRAMLIVFACACIAIAAGGAVLPTAPGSATTGYLEMMRGIPALYARYPTLRQAAARGTLWFFAFCAIWAGLAVALSQPPFSYSPERIGLYAFAGLLGIVATRISGMWTDRIGARRVILIGLTPAVLSTATLAVFLSNTAITLLCLGLVRRRTVRRPGGQPEHDPGHRSRGPRPIQQRLHDRLLHRRQPRHRLRRGGRRLVRLDDHGRTRRHVDRPRRSSHRFIPVP